MGCSPYGAPAEKDLLIGQLHPRFGRLPCRVDKGVTIPPTAPHPAARSIRKTIGCYSPNQAYIAVESRGHS
jgi:hypothetical protein